MSLGFILGVLSITPINSIAAPKALLHQVEQLDQDNSTNSIEDYFLFLSSKDWKANLNYLDIQLCFSHDNIYYLVFKKSNHIYFSNKEKYSFQNINYLSRKGDLIFN